MEAAQSDRFERAVEKPPIPGPVFGGIAGSLGNLVARCRPSPEETSREIGEGACVSPRGPASGGGVDGGFIANAISKGHSWLGRNICACGAMVLAFSGAFRQGLRLYLTEPGDFGAWSGMKYF
jgi:hypothetical protein